MQLLESGCVHEASHAVVAAHFGLEMGEVVQQPGDGNGYAMIEDHARLPATTALTVLMAGRAGEKLFTEWTPEHLDRRSAVDFVQLSTRVHREYAAQGLRSDFSTVLAHLEEHEEKAMEILRPLERVVTDVAQMLGMTGRIDGLTVKALLAEHQREVAEAEAARREREREQEAIARSVRPFRPFAFRSGRLTASNVFNCSIGHVPRVPLGQRIEAVALSIRGITSARYVERGRKLVVTLAYTHQHEPHVRARCVASQIERYIERPVDVLVAGSPVAQLAIPQRELIGAER